MTAPHPLSAVEVESLRQLRTRLNRPATSDAAAATLGRAMLQVMARMGMEPVPQASASASPAAFKDAVAVADLPALRAHVGDIAHRIVASRPGEWRAWVAAGAPQALISRRLQLAGREQVEPRG